MIRTTASLALLTFLPAVSSGGQAAGSASGAVRAASQEPSEGVTPSDDSQERVQAVVERLLEAQGGLERFEALRGFRCQFVDVDVQPPSEEGGEAVEIAAPAVQLEMQTNPEDRRIRLSEGIDLGDGQQELVRVAGEGGVKVTIDGAPNPSEQLAGEIRLRAIELLLIFDLLWGPLNGQVQATDAGNRTRDGQLYACLELRFPEARGLVDVFMIYMDPETGLVRRCDHFSGLTRLRQATLMFEDYQDADGIQLPGRVVFHDRDFQVERYWALTELAVDPEWPEGHFAVQ